MAISGNFKVKAKAIYVILCLALCSCVVNGVSLRHRRHLLEDVGLTPSGDEAPATDPSNNVIVPLKHKSEDNDGKKLKKKSKKSKKSAPPSSENQDPSKKKTPPPPDEDQSPSGSESEIQSGAHSVPVSSGGTVFDVRQFGAKADGKTDSAMAFIKAWKAACTSSKPGTVLVPSGKFVIGPVLFQGPCSAKSITFELQGNVQATTDLSDYSSPEWISFERVSGLIVKGNGVLDGQGASAWKYNDCAKAGQCADLPDQLKFFRVSNADVSGITSLNSKFFHYHVVSCDNINFHNIKVTAPADSPNTDGMHLSDSHYITVANSIIGTGDDCVSIGSGTTNLKVNGVTCGPGHGISVGSLGKYKNEEDVKGIYVTNCTLQNTDNGARIKTYPGSMPSVASSIIFEDIIMKNVRNPIIIDQHYGSKSKEPSKVKLNDIHFRNIKGTTVSEVAVTLDCSSAAPCDQVELSNINLKGSGPLSTKCQNAKVQAKGVVNPASATCGS